MTTFGINVRFQTVSPEKRHIAHALLTRLPLGHLLVNQKSLVRLACVRRAASVSPEPGSNSPSDLARLETTIKWPLA